jgi:prepilin signal peptidase PulO-like enzyme (type II secretory pathway)
MIDIILIAIGVIALLIGTVTDIKTREVPDWLNFSLIGSGVGLRLLYSIITNEWTFFLYGLIGLGVFVGLGYLMFYAGQWGGGDSKLLMGIGALFATYPEFLLKWFSPNINYSFLLAFVINLLFIGAVYGIAWSLVLSFVHKKRFKKEMKERLHERKTKIIRRILMVVVLAALISSIFIRPTILQFGIIAISFIVLVSFYVWLYAKVVEKVCMLKEYPVGKLTEGDWIAKDVKIDGKVVAGPKDLGATKEQIALLKKHVKHVMVKEGIPFVPSFLIAFVVSIIWGNLLWLLMGV